MARTMMYGEAMATAIIEEMQRDENVIFYGQNMAMTEREEALSREISVACSSGGQKAR